MTKTVCTSKTDKYKNSRLSLSEHTVMFTNKSEGIYPVIEYAGDSVTVALMNDQDEILICREYKYALDAEVFTLPSGLIDPGETQEEAAMRELIEETGCHVRNMQIIGTSHPIPANSKLCQYMLTAELDYVGPAAPEAGEDNLTHMWIPKEKAFAMAMNGEVTHGPSLAALLKLAAQK